MSISNLGKLVPTKYEVYLFGMKSPDDAEALVVAGNPPGAAE